MPPDFDLAVIRLAFPKGCMLAGANVHSAPRLVE
jgi:hypothetical protein